MHPVRVFVYGSLMSPRIARAVLGRAPAPTPATLAGYRRLGLRGHAFPGLVRRRGARTVGMLMPVSVPELWRLDAFEDDFYVRRTVSVETGGKLHRAQVYVLRRDCRRLASPREWSYEGFAGRRAAPGALPRGPAARRGDS